MPKPLKKAPGADILEILEGVECLKNVVSEADAEMKMRLQSLYRTLSRCDHGSKKFKDTDLAIDLLLDTRHRLSMHMEDMERDIGRLIEEVRK